MKRNVFKVGVLLLVGLFMFASCKHNGLPVKGGCVQITYNMGPQTGTSEIPVKLYDILCEKFESVIKAYNADKILSESRLEEMDDFAYGLRHTDIEELNEVFSLSISPKKEETVLPSLEMMSYIFEHYIDYLMEIYEIEEGYSYYYSRSEMIDEFRDNEDYMMFNQIAKQYFPMIEIEEK